MINRSDLERTIIGLIAEWAHRNPAELSVATIINSGRRGGLAVDGADAYELLEFLSKKLGWNLLNFDYRRYFGPEIGWNPVSLIIMLGKGDLKRTFPLTIGDLSEQFFASRQASFP